MIAGGATSETKVQTRKIIPIRRPERPDYQPQEERKCKYVNNGTDSQVLQQSDSRIVVITTHADDPRAKQTEKKMAVAKASEIFARRPKRQQPNGGCKRIGPRYRGVVNLSGHGEVYNTHSASRYEDSKQLDQALFNCYRYELRCIQP